MVIFMQNNLSKEWLVPGFLLSLLLHILALLTFSSVLVWGPIEKKKMPHLYVPAYTYTGKTLPLSISSSQSTETIAKPQVPVKNTATAIRQKAISLKTIMASTQQILQENQKVAIQSRVPSEPIYMIGEESEIADPLVALLGKSLSAHFRYPKIAGELGIKGRTLIGMTLEPTGYFTHIQIVRSSNNADLDAAALYAVNHAPKIIGADRFISTPKHFVVGFVFR